MSVRGSHPLPVLARLKAILWRMSARRRWGYDVKGVPANCAKVRPPWGVAVACAVWQQADTAGLGAGIAKTCKPASCGPLLYCCSRLRGEITFEASSTCRRVDVSRVTAVPIDSLLRCLM